MDIVNSGPELVPRTWAEKFALWQRFIITRLMGMRKMGEVLGQRLFPEPEQAEMAQTMADVFNTAVLQFWAGL